MSYICLKEARTVRLVNKLILGQNKLFSVAEQEILGTGWWFWPGTFRYMLFSKNVLILGVLEEAEFYNITSLIKLVKDKIRERDSKISQVRLFSSVFLIIYDIVSNWWFLFFFFFPWLLISPVRYWMAVPFTKGTSKQF